jgi:peptide/nickel transport system permease protein
MANFFLHRCGLMALSLAGVIVISFLLIHMVPGDPVDLMLGDQAALSDKIGLRHELGLDLPLNRQFERYLHDLAHLDLGRSLRTRLPVFDEILAHFPATLELSVASLLLALAWGLPLGVASAVYKRSLTDKIAGFVTLLGMSTPGVFLGPALVYLFAIKLGWFPISDRGGIEHLVLPAVSLALPLGAVLVKMTRTALLDVLHDDYMRTALAKGVSPLALYFRHALRNALIPIVTIVGLQLSALLTGTVITETIFDWPGLGLLLFDSIGSRDYPTVQGCILFIACVYVIVNFLTDLAYGVVNPRIRVDGSGS